jgi:hypothetical protein
MVTIDQLSCIGSDLITNPMTSLNGSSMQSVSPLPLVNYVALSPMTSTSDDLDPVVDMVISSIGLLESALSTIIEVVDMYSFQSSFLPSREDLLEAMIGVCPLTCIPSRELSSWKP